MTQDEIIRMAREAGALVFQSNFCNSSFDFNSEQLERFAALVAAHEREACIEKCKPYGLTGECVAIAIRARSMPRGEK